MKIDLIALAQQIEGKPADAPAAPTAQVVNLPAVIAAPAAIYRGPRVVTDNALARAPKRPVIDADYRVVEAEDPVARERAAIAAERAALTAVLDKLSRKDADFARDLLRKPATEGRRKWIKILAERAEPKPKAVVQGAGLDRIRALFDRARHYVAAPMITIGDLTLSRAKDNSRNPGSIYVKTDGVYRGKIAPTGEFSPGRDATGLETVLLAEIAADPAKAAAAHGQRTKQCSFCQKTLTHPASLTVGYGPTCAENFGLPWGAEEVARTVTVA